MTIIASLLRSAELPDSPTARLDAELLLAAALGKPRSFLHTWPERIVSSEDADTYAGYLARRRGGEAGRGRPIDTQPRRDGNYSVLVERDGRVREVVVDGQTGQARQGGSNDNTQRRRPN